MPRYFFDVVDGLEEIDDVGTELLNDQVMRAEALKFIASLLSEEPIRLGLGAIWTLIVRQEKATVLRIDVRN